MGRRRYRWVGDRSFFGNMVSEQAMAQDCLSRQLGTVVGWEVSTGPADQITQEGEKGDVAAHKPSVALKMQTLSQRHDPADRQTEMFANDNLTTKPLDGA